MKQGQHLLLNLIRRAWQTFKNDDSLIVAVLHGAGEKSFCSDCTININFDCSMPDTPAKGGLGKSKLYHTNQIAATIAKLFSEEYKTGHRTGEPINVVTQGVN